jgi:hypothetical protein
MANHKEGVASDMWYGNNQPHDRFTQPLRYWLDHVKVVGRHRGIYKPNMHWGHISCHDWGCHVATHHTVVHVYEDQLVDGKSPIIEGCTLNPGDFVTLRFHPSGVK